MDHFWLRAQWNFGPFKRTAKKKKNEHHIQTLRIYTCLEIYFVLPLLLLSKCFCLVFMMSDSSGVECCIRMLLCYATQPLIILILISACSLMCLSLTKTPSVVLCSKTEYLFWCRTFHIFLFFCYFSQSVCLCLISLFLHHVYFAEGKFLISYFHLIYTSFLNVSFNRTFQAKHIGNQMHGPNQ